MIPKHAILPDDVDDEAKSILVEMAKELTWTKRKLNLRDDLVKFALCWRIRSLHWVSVSVLFAWGR